MEIRAWIFRVTLASASCALGAGFGCSAAPSTSYDDVGAGGGTQSGGAASDGGGGSSSQCVLCVTDNDCNGGVCAQFGGDTYCAPACPNGNECASDRACTTVSSATGAQVDVCIPRGDVCGANVGPSGGGGGGGDTSDGGGANKPPPGGGQDSGAGGATCGTLVGPTGSAHCNSCGSHTCQPNGCYGGWWCNTATNQCQAPPSNCPSPGGGGGNDAGGGGGGGVDAGGPVSGNVGANGGTVSRLLFGVVGDTRPASIDDTSAYPTAVITKIFQDLAAQNPMPPFVVSTGDYMFATASGSQASPQLDLYLGARAKYPGMQFPAMGNHECTGATASNCGQGATDGVTNNYSAFLSKMLGPIGKSDPWYRIDINAQDGSWTAKFLFVAANAWNSTQSSWLSTQMAQPTTYTFIVRHEPSAANTAPGVTPSEQIMAQHPYTLAIVGHTHTYAKSGTKQITIGNGGAPLSSGGNFGYAILSQRADLSLTVDMIDYSSGQADPNFHFAIKPDGSAAP